MSSDEFPAFFPVITGVVSVRKWGCLIFGMRMLFFVAGNLVCPAFVR